LFSYVDVENPPISTKRYQIKFVKNTLTFFFCDFVSMETMPSVANYW